MRNLPKLIATILFVTLTREKFLALEIIFRAFLSERKAPTYFSKTFEQLYNDRLIDPDRTWGWKPSEQALRAFELVDAQGNRLYEPREANEGFLRPVHPQWSTQNPESFLPVPEPLPELEAHVPWTIDSELGLVEFIPTSEAQNRQKFQLVAQLVRTHGREAAEAIIARSKLAESEAKFHPRTEEARAMLVRTAARSSKHLVDEACRFFEVGC